MPAKGQTCETCNATCCHRIISYQYTDEALAQVTGEVERGETKWSTKHISTYSHKQLLAFGMIEIVGPDIGERCSKLTIDGRCSREHHKPRLCRSYWCHGRLWKPKVLTASL